ncbi:Uncharacterized protein HZ326_11958 [Fusarium oxysporum f. sp. albedinis]|nr:Uncharacterized protein HZ326_11958 [Fusarium oxysporum f. sp. albedinis]
MDVWLGDGDLSATEAIICGYKIGSSRNLIYPQQFHGGLKASHYRSGCVMKWMNYTARKRYGETVAD